MRVNRYLLNMHHSHDHQSIVFPYVVCVPVCQHDLYWVSSYCSITSCFCTSIGRQATHRPSSWVANMEVLICSDRVWHEAISCTTISVRSLTFENDHKCMLIHVTILENLLRMSNSIKFNILPYHKYSSFPPHHPYTKVLVWCCEIVWLHSHRLLVLTHSIFIASHSVIWIWHISTCFNQNEHTKRTNSHDSRRREIVEK